MAPKVTVDDLLARNKTFALKPPSMPSVADMTEKTLDPAHIVVVSCADPRATPEDYFQLKAGEVIVLRNIGGRTVPALENILVLDSFVHVSDIIVVHHTDCGATHVTEAKVRSDLKKRLPHDDNIERMQFGEIRDLQQSLKDDLSFLKSSPYIREELKPRVRGFLYDTKSGTLQELKT
ncbi:Carbonic anhydrase [Hyaloscypha variabilis]